MTGEDVLAYCLAKPGAWQDEPWEGDVVAKVGDKIFAFLGGSRRRRRRRRQVRPQPRRGERVAGALSRRRLGHGLYRPVRVEHAAHGWRHSRRRDLPSCRRFLRPGGGEAPEAVADPTRS